MSSYELRATIIKILIMVVFTLSVAGALTWLDRRQSAMIHDRVGPNRAVMKIFGIEFRLAGLLHTLADGVKFFTKEGFRPPKADTLLYEIAPIIAMGSVFALLAGIPFGDTFCPQHLWEMTDKGLVFPAVMRNGVCGIADDGSGAIQLMVAPLTIGILYIFAVSGQGVIGAAIAGWSSDNKFSLMGALRAASQMVSYEVTLGMSLIGAMMIYGTVRLDDMVRWQGDHAWGIFVQPLAFFIFFTAAIAENKRIPFDLPEAESELVSGYFTEYGGMKFGMFYFAEYAEIVTLSMLLVCIFLGGWELPFFHRDGLTIQFGETVVLHQLIPHIWMTIIGVCAFFGKTLFICWIQAFTRWALPRFRYDQLMKLGWRILLPASLINVFVTGAVYLAIDQAGVEASDGLRLAGDVTQGLVVLVSLYFFVRLFVGFFGARVRTPWALGSAAVAAGRVGGTKTTAMQA